MNISNKLLQVKEVYKTFGEGQSETAALKGVSFEVLPGEFLGIMGASGSGKTTLLNVIATMLKPTAGQILLEGKNISSFKGSRLAEYRGSKIGYLFQQFELIDNLTARENIILPLSIHGVNLKEQEEQLQKLVNQFDIENVINKFPSQLSGGQKQRVAVARALISNPSIVLADEPTGALDTKNAKTLMDKLYANNQTEGSTILMVTHDANAASYCSRILFIQDGVIFHKLRKKVPGETKNSFYERILTVLAQLGGGSSNVL